MSAVTDIADLDAEPLDERIGRTEAPRPPKAVLEQDEFRSKDRLQGLKARSLKGEIS